jgi:hypothetical protein
MAYALHMAQLVALLVVSMHLAWSELSRHFVCMHHECGSPRQTKRCSYLLLWFSSCWYGSRWLQPLELPLVFWARWKTWPMLFPALGSSGLIVVFEVAASHWKENLEHGGGPADEGCMSIFMCLPRT